MGFVDDDQIRGMIDECLTVSVGLHVVDGTHQVIVVLEDAHVRREAPLQSGHARGLDDRGVDMELAAEFVRPLLAEMRRAEHSNTTHDSSIQQFTGNHSRLDGLAHADVISDQQAHWIQAQRHQQGDILVGARRDRQPTQRAKRPCSASQSQSGSVEDQAGPADVRGLARIRRRILRGSGLCRFEARQNTDSLMFRTIYRSKPQRVAPVAWQDDPIAAAKR